MPKDTSRKQKQRASESEESPREKLKTQVKHFGEEAKALGEKVGAKGEAFGKQIGEKGEALGKQLGAKGEEFGKKADTCDAYCDRHYTHFGIIWPIVSALFGLICLGLGIWILDFFSEKNGFAILSPGVRDFLVSKAAVFFLIFLASSYMAHLSRVGKRAYLLISPISSAFGITVFFWIFSNILIIDNARIAVPAFYSAAQYVNAHLLGLFWFFLIIGYIFLFIRFIFQGVSGVYRNIENNNLAQPSRKSQVSGGPKRLYRSGNDKVIAGVCGGIAEYLNVDPVLIRLIWVALILAGGSGILLYIIAWIVIPRNPDHKWR